MEFCSNGHKGSVFVNNLNLNENRLLVAELKNFKSCEEMHSFPILMIIKEKNR